jgi:hypothetical protein
LAVKPISPSQWIDGFARTPVIPEATVVGALSALLGRSIFDSD